MPRPPTPQPDELVEEVFLRFPPENPAGLVRAGLVCTRWCRLVSDPGFRRRFREFHYRPPMLGAFCNIHEDYEIGDAPFIPTCALSFPRTHSLGLRVLDARHGRVLCQKGNALAVLDPMTDLMLELPFPQKYPTPWTAAILCSALGACDHLDCHQGPFFVVFVCYKSYRYGDLSLRNGCSVVYTYSSKAASWSEPVCARNYFARSSMGSVLVENAFYFGNIVETTALKYKLEFCRALLIELPCVPDINLLTTTEDGGLGFVNKVDSKLYVWSMRDTLEVDAIWEKRSVIELKTVFPADVVIDVVRE